MSDITKKYTTRSGLPVRLYAVDGAGFYRVHGAVQQSDGWWQQVWAIDGTYNRLGINDEMDLIPVKTWRAWERNNEGPQRFIIHWKNHNRDSCEVTHRSSGYSDKYLFENATWLHEDGTETPCGVEMP